MLNGFNKAPEYFALGFAAFLLVMKTQPVNGGFQGQVNGGIYALQDDKAAHFSEKWALLPADKLVEDVLRDEALWGADLAEPDGLLPLVAKYLQTLLREGAKKTMLQMITDKSVIQS